MLLVYNHIGFFTFQEVYIQCSNLQLPHIPCGYGCMPVVSEFGFFRIDLMTFRTMKNRRPQAYTPLLLQL